MSGPSDDWRWCGRTVKSVDGTTVSMPDTPANQAEYPQSRSQAPGLGFPLARLVVVFCLATGVVLESAIGAARGKKTGENSLFRSLWDSLEPGEVVLADRLLLFLFRYRDVEGPGRGRGVPSAPDSGSATSDAVVAWGVRTRS